MYLVNSENFKIFVNQKKDRPFKLLRFFFLNLKSHQRVLKQTKNFQKYHMRVAVQSRINLRTSNSNSRELGTIHVQFQLASNHHKGQKLLWERAKSRFPADIKTHLTSGHFILTNKPNQTQNNGSTSRYYN